MVYAGAAMGAVFAGDLLTLFVYWELTAVASMLVIWARGTERAFRAGLRYIAVQLASGMLLAGGAALQYAAKGSLAFDAVGVGGPGGMLLLAAFGIKCAFPLLHNWLQDAYPEATATGTVVLSAFTTKLGVYALARGFAGTEALVWIGTAMAAFPIFYAVIENDLRRVLAYSMNNQIGFMVVGVGLGTELGTERRGGARVRGHPVQGTALHVDGCGAAARRQRERHRPRGALQVDAAHRGVLHRRCRVDLRVPAVQRLRHQVDDHGLGGGAGLRRRVARAAVRLGRRVPSRRHQDPVLRVLRARLGHPLQGGAGQHARRDGASGGAVRRHRRVSVGALRVSSRSRSTTSPTPPRTLSRSCSSSSSRRSRSQS